MNTPPQTTVDNAGVKLATVWALIGITSWADVASLLAAIYSACLLGEWMWKKAIRPYAERRGWIARNVRRHDDAT